MKFKTYINLVMITFFIIFPTFIHHTTAFTNAPYVVVLEPGQYHSIEFNFDIGYLIDVEFEVVSGDSLDIDVFIADENNFELWKNDLDANFYQFYEHKQYAKFTFIVSKSEPFYLVFSNAFSEMHQSPKTVEFNFASRGFFAVLLSNPIYIFGIIALIGIGVFLIIQRYLNRLKLIRLSQPVLPTIVQSTSILSSPSIQSATFSDTILITCNQCGSPQPIGAEFCHLCGSKLH